MIGAQTGLRSVLAKPAWGLAAAAALAALLAPAQARVTRIVIDTRVSPAFNGASFGNAGPYETLAGHAFGELDPDDPHNAVIQDIKLAPRNARGIVEYTASFQLTKPIDMSRSSQLMWHDVPNRSAARQRHRHGTGRQESRRLADHRAGHGAHPQCGGPELAAHDRTLQPAALSPGHARCKTGDAHHARLRVD